MGLAIVLGMLGGLFSMYSKGNKAAAKGTWRVNAVKQQRLALRRVKDKLEKSSYPSLIAIDDYHELSPDFGSEAYVMDLGEGTPSPSSPAGIDQFDFKNEGEIVTFYTCTPRQEFEEFTNPIPSIPGKAEKITLSLVQTGTTTNSLALVLTTAVADITRSGDVASVGGFSDEFSYPPIVNNVSLVSIGVDSRSTTREKTVLEFSVECTDPFDGRLRVTETAKAVVNVRVKR